jgi:hypothetical protein
MAYCVVRKHQLRIPTTFKVWLTALSFLREAILICEQELCIRMSIKLGDYRAQGMLTQQIVVIEKSYKVSLGKLDRGVGGF